MINYRVVRMALEKSILFRKDLHLAEASSKKVKIMVKGPFSKLAGTKPLRQFYNSARLPCGAYNVPLISDKISGYYIRPTPNFHSSCQKWHQQH